MALGDQTLPGPGQVSYDYSGSAEEDFQRVVRDLIRRYVLGLGGIGSDDPELGRPSQEDYASGKDGQVGQYSNATQQYWERFVRKYRSTDPFMLENYGPPPSKNATFQPDPEGQAANNQWQGTENEKDRALERELEAGRLGESAADRAARERMAAAELASREMLTRLEQEAETNRLNARIAADAAENEKARTFQSGESALERAFREQQASMDRDLARERESAETNRVQMGIDSDWKIAQLQDITRRYEAEGTWGVQKYVAELQEKGALERLQLELNLREKEMAQEAIAEGNRHHAEMVRLTLEVAKYDAEIAAEPRNWLKYAAWLDNRGQVVNGLTLAMASEEIPEESISGADLAASQLPGTNVEAAAAPAPTTAPPPTANAPAASTGEANAQALAGTPQQQTQPSPYTVNGVDLENRNYGELLNQILGPNAGQAGVDNSQANLSNILAGLDTTGQLSPGQTGSPAQQAPVGSGNGGSPQIGAALAGFNATGRHQDYRKFAQKSPVQQQMIAGAVEGKGVSFDDFLFDLNKARPRGGRTGAVSYG